MKPDLYIEIDNQLTTNIFQVRNDGRIEYNLILKLDINKYLNGENIINCLILNELDLNIAFTPLDFDYGDSLTVD